MDKTQQISLKERSNKIFNYLWDQQSKDALLHWAKLLISLKGMWFFLPTLLGILFAYWVESKGMTDTIINKGTHESLAIWLMGITTALYLARFLIFKLEIDLILTVMSANFLCREIHFPGTDAGVFVVAVIVVLWTLFWKDRILKNLENADMFQAFMTATILIYLMAILIQKRVFKPHRIPLLPNENVMHVPLEELLENIAHSFLLITGIVAFFSISHLNRLYKEKK